MGRLPTALRCIPCNSAQCRQRVAWRACHTSRTRPLDPTKYYYTAVTLLRRVHEAIVDLAHGVWGAHAVLVVRNGVDLKAGVLGIPR